jgi:phage shock protein E
MKWKLALLTGIAVFAAIALRGESTLPADQARQHLKAGALLVDVRTREEFQTGGLSGAVNIPLDTIKTGLTNLAPDKGKVVLVHCQSGRRSAVAEKQLRALGYTNVFNIGSFDQARRIVAPETK